jgi:cell division protein FtsB
MSIRKYLLALWLGIAVYSSASFTLGPMGIFAYQRARRDMERLRNNMEELKTINRGLQGAMDALRYDSDTIMAYARELGYGTPEERFIRIVGLPGAVKKRAAAGQLLLYAKPDTIRDRTLRIIALASGALVFAFLTLVEYIKNRRRSRNRPFSPSDPLTGL